MLKFAQKSPTTRDITTSSTRHRVTKTRVTVTGSAPNGEFSHWRVVVVRGACCVSAGAPGRCRRMRHARCPGCSDRTVRYVGDCSRPGPGGPVDTRDAGVGLPRVLRIPALAAGRIHIPPLRVRVIDYTIGDGIADLGPDSEGEPEGAYRLLTTILDPVEAPAEELSPRIRTGGRSNRRSTN